MKKIIAVLLFVSLILCGCAASEKAEESEVVIEEKTEGVSYVLNSVHEVNGRQGIASEGDYYWVSGSTTLTKYDRDFNIVAENTDPFKGYEL